MFVVSANVTEAGMSQFQEESPRINIVGLKRSGYSSEEINVLKKTVDLIFSNKIFKNGIEEARKFSKFKTVADVIIFLEKNKKRPICRP